MPCEVEIACVGGDRERDRRRAAHEIRAERDRLCGVGERTQRERNRARLTSYCWLKTANASKNSARSLSSTASSCPSTSRRRRRRHTSESASEAHSVKNRAQASAMSDRPPQTFGRHIQPRNAVRMSYLGRMQASVQGCSIHLSAPLCPPAWH